MTPPTPYDDLDEEEQVEVLRPAALGAAHAFGLDVARMEPVLHAYNTTFAVDTVGGERFALRVGTNSKSTPANVRAQQAWQEAIATTTDVVVPRPLRTTDGGWFVTAEPTGLARPVLVTAASWLEGDDAGDEASADWARALGRATATLHRQSAAWSMPEDADLPRFEDPLFGDREVLLGAPGLADTDRVVLVEALRRTREAFERLSSGAEVVPLHADLHGGNLKWHEGRLAVFDFDDAGLGIPVLDLAITTFYLRRGGAEAAEAALREGYAEVAPLPDADPGDVEALVAARQLLLANSLLDSSTASLRAMADDYRRTTVARLRHWFDTGTFRLDVEG
ncbi:phosphotransferase enzyme family protein [Phycicoccus sonneratiae]|uniref:Phosphotransferase n=1 Tax=Phycicoccus sonneratiae TaxID=2807628 RepID=A0ABS2CIN2_9MICO|nr:phosphotransferase [Phycicoccus sonneraticus]MBM6399740.1 phosphotransferase [Phycicoccus sonneraticus]